MKRNEIVEKVIRALKKDDPEEAPGYEAIEKLLADGYIGPLMMVAAANVAAGGNEAQRLFLLSIFSVSPYVQEAIAA